MEHVELIEDSSKAKQILFSEGLLNVLGKPYDNHSLKTCIHRTPKFYVLGIRYLEKGGRSGYAVVRGDIGRVSPQDWASYVANLVTGISSPGTIGVSEVNQNVEGIN